MYDNFFDRINELTKLLINSLIIDLRIISYTFFNPLLCKKIKRNGDRG